MRSIITLTMLRGQVVHAVIAEALRSVRIGQKVDAQMARRRVTELLRARYMESAKKLWHIDNRPPGAKASQITNLLEHYYHFSDINELARNTQQVAWLCVNSLMNSQVWGNIVESDSANWMQIDEIDFPSFDLDGIRVYAQIDFAYKGTQQTIIDWKTGAKSTTDREQLILYSLCAKQKWGWNPLQTKLCTAYLQPQFELEEFTPAQGDIDELESSVKASFAEMLELEPLSGQANIEDFPMTEDIKNCQWCRFAGVCEGAKRSITS